MKVAQYKCTFSPELALGMANIVIATIQDLADQEVFFCDVLIWNNNETFGVAELAKFPKLKKLINWGTDDINIDFEALAKQSVVVYKVDYYATIAVAEFIISLLLTFERRHDWLLSGEKHYGHELSGKRVGIIGLGKIGYRTAMILRQGFHCDTYYYSRTDKQLPHVEFKPMAWLFEHCDYVIITAKSKHFVIDKTVFERANPQLVIANVTRDSVLPLEELLPLLEKKVIRGFVGDLGGLGVPTNMLDRVVVTPHSGYLTHEARKAKHLLLSMFLSRHCVSPDTVNPVYIVRHGQTEWNVQGKLQGSHDSPLTKEGVHQAEQLATFFKDKGIKRIYASPLGRAQATAARIAKVTGAEVITVPAFKEMSFGVFEGRERKLVREVFADFFESQASNPQYKLLVPYPAGESYADVYLRVLSSLLEVAQTADAPCVIVGHESVNRMLRGIMLNRSLEEMIYMRQSHNEIVRLDAQGEKIFAL